MQPVTPEARTGARAVVFAKDQPQYIPLPANVTADGKVETKWQLNWQERMVAWFTGNIYLTVSTYGKPLQPIRGSLLREED